MSSKIEWTDETWNPTLGCTRVSPGCDGCYAIRQSRIRSGNPHPAIAAAHAGLTERRDGRLDWTGQVRLLPQRLDQPLHWRRPRRIFVDSLTDLFHDEVPDAFIWSVWVTMARTPQHTYQVLTKRHGRMRSLLTRWAADGWIARDHRMLWNDLSGHVGPSGLPNVWLGVSVEDQQRADLRIPALFGTPAAVRWISAEPLLGPVDLLGAVDGGCDDVGPAITHDGFSIRTDYGTGVEYDCDHQAGLDWVVVGGESGPGARPMAPAWARSLRDQCAAADVPFLFKQWGDWGPTGAVGLGSPHPERSIIVGPPRGPHGVGEELVRVGKKAAGRLLDGVEHDGYPEVAA